MRVLAVVMTLGIALTALGEVRADGIPGRASVGASVYLPMFGNADHAKALLVGEYALGDGGWAAKTRLGAVASDAGTYGLKLSYELVESRLRVAGVLFDGGDFSAGLELVAGRVVF